MSPASLVDGQLADGPYIDYLRRVKATLGARTWETLETLPRHGAFFGLLVSAYCCPYGDGRQDSPSFVPLAPEAVLLAQARDRGEAAVEIVKSRLIEEPSVEAMEAMGMEARLVRAPGGVSEE